jgi:glutamate dehydrogenase (NADP+)
MSGLEMSQNSERRSWSNEDLRNMLRELMTGIHARCAEIGTDKDGFCNYVAGANIAGFKKVANAMLAFGVV